MDCVCHDHLLDWIDSFGYTSGVLHGTGGLGHGSGPNSYLAGDRSSLEAFITQSHFSARPVYALIRPMIAVIVLSSICLPSLSLAPLRIASSWSACARTSGS